MLILHDTVDSVRTPFVNNLLILLNVVVFAWQISLGMSEEMFRQHGIIPYDFLHHFGLAAAGTMISSIFMHADVMHLLGNMWVLFIFGDNVEDRLGKFGYLIFYLACGCIADLMHILANPLSHNPLIGASGAIAGVLGAYLVLYPLAGVRIFLTLWFFPIVPAWLVIIGWFCLNCLYSILAPTSSIAWYAHIGGFIFGATMFFVMPSLVRNKEHPDIEKQASDPFLGHAVATRESATFKDEIAACLFVMLIIYMGIFAFRNSWRVNSTPVQQPMVSPPHRHNVPSHNTRVNPKGKPGTSTNAAGKPGHRVQGKNQATHGKKSSHLNKKSDIAGTEESLP